MKTKLVGLHADAPVWVDPLHRPENSYFGYFEDLFDEVWVLLVTPEEILLSGSDIDWEIRRIQFAENGYADIKRFSVIALINQIGQRFDLGMDEDERLWLTGAIRAGTRKMLPPKNPRTE
jgi:hypothetical protein